ncbi:MAG TPA: hypothetical protein DD671_09720, partial [Balneolaceae bacterium]|nr:hypothetical protein [Balneolaceae bacterium]
VGLYIEGDKFYLTVEDNGVGFSEEWDIDKFGTVGFMLINTLVQQLGGEIKFKNVPGTGTKFEVSFKKDYNKGSQSSLSNNEIENLID